MSAKALQRRAYQNLLSIYGSADVRWEWSVRQKATDFFEDRSIYAPRLDLAVGPFNLSAQNRDQDADKIRKCSNDDLVQTIVSLAKAQNGGYVAENKNPRCLLAIEIEFSGSSKHMLGDFTNASLMGLFGIVVVPKAKIDKLQRIATYARRLREAAKAPEDLFLNIACLEERDFIEILKGTRKSSNESHAR